MIGPDKDDNSGFADWKDYHSGASSIFTYNPAAADISKPNSAFPEVDDVEAPEKM
jgi:hypothetical protein